MKIIDMQRHWLDGAYTIKTEKCNTFFGYQFEAGRYQNRQIFTRILK